VPQVRKFHSYIQWFGKEISVGHHSLETEAARARDLALVRVTGVTNVPSELLNRPDLCAQPNSLDFRDVDRFLSVHQLAPHASWRVENVSRFPNLKPSLLSSPSASSTPSLLPDPQSADYAARLALSQYDWGTTSDLIPPISTSSSISAPLRNALESPYIAPAPMSPVTKEYSSNSAPSPTSPPESQSDVSPPRETGQLSLQQLGAALLPLVRKHQPDIATSVVKILLEMEIEELNHLLLTPSLLPPIISDITKLLKRRSSLSGRPLTSDTLSSRASPEAGSSPPGGITLVPRGVHNDDKKNY
jgi:hypothetical protein